MPSNNDNKFHEDKKMFVYILTAAIHMTRAGADVACMNYYMDKDTGEEYVDIVYDSGYVKRVCVTADSCIAIMIDIAKALS